MEKEEKLGPLDVIDRARQAQLRVNTVLDEQMREAGYRFVRCGDYEHFIDKSGEYVPYPVGYIRGPHYATNGSPQPWSFSIQGPDGWKQRSFSSLSIAADWLLSELGEESNQEELVMTAEDTRRVCRHHFEQFGAVPLSRMVIKLAEEMSEVLEVCLFALPEKYGKVQSSKDTVADAKFLSEIQDVILVLHVLQAHLGLSLAAVANISNVDPLKLTEEECIVRENCTKEAALLCRNNGVDLEVMSKKAVALIFVARLGSCVKEFSRYVEGRTDVLDRVGSITRLMVETTRVLHALLVKFDTSLAAQNRLAVDKFLARTWDSVPRSPGELDLAANVRPRRS